MEPKFLIESLSFSENFQRFGFRIQTNTLFYNQGSQFPGDDF